MCIFTYVYICLYINTFECKWIYVFCCCFLNKYFSYYMPWYVVTNVPKCLNSTYDGTFCTENINFTNFLFKHHLQFNELN